MQGWQPSGSKILGGGGTTSEEARHKKALLELRGAYVELQRQQSAAAARAEDCRLKLKECRATLGLKEKQLETSQLLLQRVNEEKQQIQVRRSDPIQRARATHKHPAAGTRAALAGGPTKSCRPQASAASDKAQARKLELRMSDLKGLPELQDKYSRLKKQVGRCCRSCRWRAPSAPSLRSGGTSAAASPGRRAKQQRSQGSLPAGVQSRATRSPRPRAQALPRCPPPRRRTLCSSG
jgi:hypothetical protein